MGLIGSTTPRRMVVIYRWLFKKNVVVRTLSEIDANLLAIKFNIPVSHIPFGVDISFWLPAETRLPSVNDNFVLSIGNDSHRDYQTLLAAWKPEYPMLRIVTSQNIITTALNIEVIRGNWYKQVITDVHIRTLMQSARFVILPIKTTNQPSGQSACLQAMACGKSVIITDFLGLWNRELLLDGKTCIIAGPPGDRTGIQIAVQRLLSDPALAFSIGTNARKVMESDLNVNQMAKTIAADLDKLMDGSFSSRTSPLSS